MTERMIGIGVHITRYLDDDPLSQPVILECEFTDAEGQCRRFVEKHPVVAFEDPDEQAPFPQPGVIACEIRGRGRNSAGQETVLVDTERPWGVETVDGETQFAVLPETMVEWVLGENGVRPWSGLISTTVSEREPG